MCQYCLNSAFSLYIYLSMISLAFQHLSLLIRGRLYFGWTALLRNIKVINQGHIIFIVSFWLIFKSLWYIFWCWWSNFSLIGFYWFYMISYKRLYAIYISYSYCPIFILLSTISSISIKYSFLIYLYFYIYIFWYNYKEYC